MSNYNIDALMELKNNVLNRRRNADINDLDNMKELNREYSRIQMKIKYYSSEDYRKAKCETVKAYNKKNVEYYNNYQKLYQRNKKLNQLDE
jgi:hypothetical protein